MWDESKCNLCGDCLVRCLYVGYDRDKAVAEIEALMEGKPAEILGRCITCCGCREYCPTGADPFDLICKMQEKMGAFPIPEAAAALFERRLQDPSEVLPGDPDRPVLSLWITERNLPEDILDSEQFRGLTVVKGGEYCCPIGYVHIGKESGVAKSAPGFIDRLARLGKEIIFLHDDCYASVHAKIRDYDLKAPFDYMHLFQYLYDYLRRHQDRVTPIRKKIAYQRPCSSRYVPEKDALLGQILQLIGVERVPRKYDGEDALCCTAPIIPVYPELAAEVQDKNVRDAIAHGAEALITLCPLCDRVLKRPASRLGLPNMHITQLCRIALGEKSWPA
ncbi:MAG: heterodisulfide reductase-related iron-sulfur binding cluster [Dehalococcoidia bacterium]